MFPSVDRVGFYVGEEEFEKQRLDAGGWVHYNELVCNIIEGRYDRIKPLHIEVCVTYRCNFNCPWCSCRSSRNKYKGVPDLGRKNIERIVDECLKHEIGIQWTGGEPLMNEEFISSLSYATEKGIKQCLFTNGSLVSAAVATELMKSNLSFVRISLNSATPDVHRDFHGKISLGLSHGVISGLELLCKTKINLKSKVRIGVSIVVNNDNIGDLSNTYTFLYEMVKKYPSALNFIVVRPVNGSIHDVNTSINDSFYEKYEDANKDESITSILKENVKVVFPFMANGFSCDCIKCRGCFLFSEISPDGDMFLCSDRYGDKRYKIGNVLENDFEGIFCGQEKENAIKQNENCLAEGKCPDNSRGRYFNSLFDQIEDYRNKGKMSVVVKWIEELKKMIPDEGNSFFI